MIKKKVLVLTYDQDREFEALAKATTDITHAYQCKDLASSFVRNITYEEGGGFTKTSIHSEIARLKIKAVGIILKANSLT